MSSVEQARRCRRPPCVCYCGTAAPSKRDTFRRQLCWFVFVRVADGCVFEVGDVGCDCGCLARGGSAWGGFLWGFALRRAVQPAAPTVAQHRL